MKKYLKYLLAGISAFAFAFVLGVNHFDNNSKAYTLQPNGTLISDNLLEFDSIPDTTINGITYKVENGVLTLNGTATIETNIQFDFIPFTLNGQYTLSAFNDVTYLNGLFLSTNIGNYTVWLADLNAYTTFNATNATISNLSTWIPQGTVFSNNTISPMLSLGSSIPTTYEPYGIYYPSSYVVNMQNTLALSMCDLFDSPSCVGVSGNVPLSTNAFTNLINNNYVIPYINKVSLQDSRVPAVISSVKSTYDDSYSSCMLVDGSTCSLVSLPSGIVSDDVRSIPYYIEAIVSNISQSDYVSISTEFYNQGYSNGYDVAYVVGKRDGYNIGYNAGLEEDGVLGDAIIATASTPVTILSQFLSFDLLGINLWFLVAGFVTLGIIIWLIKRFFK